MSMRVPFCSTQIGSGRGSRTLKSLLDSDVSELALEGCGDGVARGYGRKAGKGPYGSGLEFSGRGRPLVMRAGL